MISHYRNMDVYNLWQRMIGFESFGWKISSTWNPDLVTFKIWDMDVVDINELLKKEEEAIEWINLEKIKNLKVKSIFFFRKKIYLRKILETGNFLQIPKIILLKLFSVKYFTAKQTDLNRLLCLKESPRFV